LAAFDGLTRAVGADVHDGLADEVENRLGGGEVVFRTANHDRQRGVLGAGLTAGHRRVDDSQSTLGADLGELRGDVGPDRGEVDHQGARLSMGEDPVIAQQDALHLGGVRHHDRQPHRHP